MRESNRFIRFLNRARDKVVDPNNDVSRAESLKAYIREGTQAEAVAPVIDRWLDDLETRILKSLAIPERNRQISVEELSTIYRTGLDIRKSIEHEIVLKIQKSEAYDRNFSEEKPKEES